MRIPKPLSVSASGDFSAEQRSKRMVKEVLAAKLCGQSLSVGEFSKLPCLALASAVFRQLHTSWELGSFAPGAKSSPESLPWGPRAQLTPQRCSLPPGCGRRGDLSSGLHIHQLTDLKPVRQTLGSAPSGAAHCVPVCTDLVHCIPVCTDLGSWSYTICPNNRHHVQDFL